MDGTQSQDRRPITVPWYKGKRVPPYEPYYTESDGKLFYMDEYGDFHPMEEKAPWQVGDMLYVREAFRVDDDDERHKILYGQYTTDSVCIANEVTQQEWDDFSCWKHPYRGKPSLHMFKSLARIWLKVKSVRPERIQDISESDAMAEGDPKQGLIASENTHTDWFKGLWDSLYKKQGYGWDTNSWVWRTEFERITKQ